tara:strand:- start:580 stop:726 length:147 start_codon:yes stop_codon:yes gene_type:complete
MSTKMSIKIYLSLFVLVSILFLSGCGNMGELYLPEDREDHQNYSSEKN